MNDTIVVVILMIEPHTPIKPMLLESAPEPPAGDYIYQMKLDGFRCLLSYTKGHGVTLYTRHQNPCTIQFPELQIDLPVDSLILDGEMVVLIDGKPCFESVMKRFLTKKDQTIKNQSSQLPSNYGAFDILYLNGQPLHNLPLTQRLDILKDIELPTPIFICPYHDNGSELFTAIKNMGLEGVVSKKKDSRWIENIRSKNWIKSKAWRTVTVSISAIRKNEFGCSMILDGKYVGNMELMPAKDKSLLYGMAERMKIKEDNKWMYLSPGIPCDVKYHSYTSSGIMRDSTFVAFSSL
jgi:DNA ligase-1